MRYAIRKKGDSQARPFVGWRDPGIASHQIAVVCTKCSNKDCSVRTSHIRKGDTGFGIVNDL